ncbi:YncE family protein [Halorubrum sp. CGM5_25_10-8B]|uniref:YncE family protein n=1 Tax=Halorubrum sp. CGM5_25_10-8B TaxID=2518115 RepID=UPI001F5448D9|nr:YncE family protein [Halorubrum sp. CGM5_25_10-8B]
MSGEGADAGASGAAGGDAGDDVGPDGDPGDAPERVVAVPCEGADVLALFDLATGEPLGSVPVGSHPVHATTTADRTFVATMGERSVTAVAPGGEVTRVDTGVLGPSHFASANGELYVACSAGDALAVIDPVELTRADRIGVGAEPHELAVGPDERRLYSGSRRDGVVDVVDTATHERIRSVDVGPEARVQGVALAPDGHHGYAVDQEGDRIVAFEPAGHGDRYPDAPATRVGQIRKEAAVGADPYDLVVTLDRVFVPGRADGTVHEFSPDLTLESVHEGFSRPVDLFRANGRWWVLDAEAARLRSLDGDLVDTNAPSLVAAPVGGGRLVASHYDDDRISLVDVADGTVWTADTPAYPFGAVVV